MKKMKFGILMVLAVLALVAVASAQIPFGGYNPVDATPNYPNAPVSYWSVDVTAGDPPVSDLPVANGYTGWCTDTDHSLEPGDSHTFTAYSSLLGGWPASMPYAGMNWNKINYILNVPPSNGDWRIRQAAIWHYDGMSGDLFPEDEYLVNGYDHTVYTNYIKAIDANGGSFIPKCGQLYAIILYDRGYQVIIVQVPTEECHGSPEFPTLALPAAMLVGVAGVVHYIRSREER